MTAYRTAEIIINGVKIRDDAWYYIELKKGLGFTSGVYYLMLMYVEATESRFYVPTDPEYTGHSEILYEHNWLKLGDKYTKKWITSFTADVVTKIKRVGLSNVGKKPSFFI